MVFCFSSVLYFGLEPDGCVANIYRKNLDVLNDMPLLKFCLLEKPRTFLEEPNSVLFKNSKRVLCTKSLQGSQHLDCARKQKGILERPS